MSSAPTMLNHLNVTLQLNGVPGVHESVLLSQLVDPLRLVEVLPQPGDALAVEREDLLGRDRVWKHCLQSTPYSYFILKNKYSFVSQKIFQQWPPRAESN